MRKIFSILVTLMVIGLTFMSCTPATSDNKNGTGSSIGIDTTVPPISNDSAALENFMKETFDDFTQSDNGKVYSGKIPGTENDYVLIPATAAVPTSDEFSKVDDNEYSFGAARLIKDSTEGINVYLYGYEHWYLYFGRAPNTISMSTAMYIDYFDCNINEFIEIGGIRFNIA